MNTKLIIIISFTYAYGFLELFLGLKQKQNRTVEKRNDKGSIWALFISIFIGYSLSFMVGATKTGRIYNWDLLFTIGAILVIIGLFIRVKAIFTLKQHFTYTVTKVENHKLIETGLYKFIRHPGYLGQLIIFLGIATSISNWLSVLCMMTPVFIGYMYRIKTEEKFMTEQIGQEYIDYQKRTKKLIPRIF